MAADGATRYRWAKLGWVFAWPPLFITAFVASGFFKEPAQEEPLLYEGLGGGAGGWALFFLGLFMVVLWAVGCLALLIQAAHWALLTRRRSLHR